MRNKRPNSVQNGFRESAIAVCEYFFRIFSFDNFIEAEKDSGTITPSDRQQESIKLQKSPIFFLSRILAIFPFSCNQRLRIGCLLLSYSLVVLLTFVIFSLQHAQKICKTEQSSTNILLYMGYLLVDTTMIIICIVTPIVNRKSIISILKGKTLIFSKQLQHKMYNDYTLIAGIFELSNCEPNLMIFFLFHI